MTQDEDRDQQLRYVQRQSEYVSTLGRDHLHSNAYLQELIDYLQQAFKQPRLKVVEDPIPKSPHVFVQYYRLADGTIPTVTPYTNPTDFTTDRQATKSQDHHNAIVFMQGQPSTQWLIALGAHFGMDLRFFHKHLEFLSENQRDWFAEPTIPSRSKDSFKLSIPSIIFVGAAKRFMSTPALQSWRASCTAAIDQHMQSVQAARSSDAGQSLLRRASIFAPDRLVAEQDITIYLRADGKCWQLFIWSDAGDPRNIAKLLFSKHETDLQNQFSFCPVFFNTNIDQPLPKKGTGHGAPINSVQPLCALASDYGRTLQWENASKNPILALIEIFRFHASASMQCLNMLEQLINETLTRIRLGNVRLTKLEDVEVFEYTQISLQRYLVQYDTVLRFLRIIGESTAEANFPWTKGLTATKAPLAALESVREDLNFIHSKAQALSTLCDSGRSTIMSNASVQEALYANEQAKLVTQLSKITYRLTFIFLPLSYVASLFGMNFRQFGQGELDLWIWAAVTVPLVSVCILYVECGETIRRGIVGLVGGETKP